MARAVKTQAGIVEKKIFSNLMVKSKSSRQPWTLGPTELSFKHAMVSCGLWTKKEASIGVHDTRNGLQVFLPDL
jgi:hypothetical protein